jgi:chemotaxis protein methyltransferase CheR
MSISLHQTGTVTRIDVLGDLESMEDRKTLAEHLRAASDGRYELSFFDAHTLPVELMELLAQRLDAGHSLKIYAYHNYLVHSLLRIGLPAIYVPSHSTQPNFGIFSALALAGSAESLDKILYLVEHLPPAEVAIFILQHILEDSENYLDKLLRVRTEYAVVMPQHLMPVTARTIYVAPPGHHMKVSHGLVYLTRDRKVQYARPSIDVLFESLAEEYGKRALGVLLCGFGEDGIQGIRTLQARGACVLVEESDECTPARVLTDHARDSGHYDLLLGVKAIASFLAAAVSERSREPSAQMLALFLHAIYDRYGYDFRGYQQGTVLRRIDKMVRLLELASFFDFQREVFGDSGVFERFFQELSINVTEFFRHPLQFHTLREQILPYLDSFPHIKVWSAGCATGEEVYSLIILLDELGMLKKTQIFATDINAHVLAQAQAGLFPLNALASSRSNYLASGGSRRFDDYVENTGRFLKIADRYRDHILFHHHSLAHDGVFNEFQLILCRNVLIYFDADLQTRVMERFSRSLHPDGFLILGPSESLGNGEGKRFFSACSTGQSCYRWRSGSR